MKIPKGSIPGYVPGTPPADLPPAARQYLDEELNRIAGVLANILAAQQALTNSNGTGNGN